MHYFIIWNSQQIAAEFSLTVVFAFLNKLFGCTIDIWII